MEPRRCGQQARRIPGSKRERMNPRPSRLITGTRYAVGITASVWWYITLNRLKKISCKFNKDGRIAIVSQNKMSENTKYTKK
jgi:hypothetical protein